MNQVSSKHFAQQALRCALLLAAATLSACAYFMPPPAPVKPAKLRPAAVDNQQKDRARQALQKATASSNEYSACVMFATSTHRNGNISPSEIAAAACSNCAPKLDDYEKGMVAYYEEAPLKAASPSTSSAKDRAHERRVELEQTTREAAMHSLEKAN